MLTINDLAHSLNVSVFTINRWYRWQKANNLDCLPNPIKIGNRNYWQDTDLPKLIKFQKQIIKGRNGVMSHGKKRSTN